MIGIIYYSKHGCTRTVVETLANKLNNAGIEAEIIQAKDGLSSFDVEKYDHVILGSSIYIGKVGKDIRKFLDKYESQLLQKPLSLFLCSAFNEEQAFVNNFGDKLMKHAQNIMELGSEIEFSRLGFLEKTIAKAVKSGEFSNINYEQIDDLANKVISGSHIKSV